MSNLIHLDRAKLQSSKSKLQAELTRKIEHSKQATLDHIREIAADTAEQLALRTFPSSVGIIYAVKAIRQDVNKIYALPGRVYEILHNANPANANAFWVAIKSGDLNQATARVRTSGTHIAGIIIGSSLDPNLHNQSRNPSDGRVVLPATLQMVTKNELQAYTKLAIKRLGKTASGWFAASDDLGGNGGGSSWKSISIHGKSGGRANISISDQIKVTLINTSPLARKHLSPGQIAAIMNRARTRLLQAIKTTFKKAA